MNRPRGGRGAYNFAIKRSEIAPPDSYQRGANGRGGGFNTFNTGVKRPEVSLLKVELHFC